VIRGMRSPGGSPGRGLTTSARGAWRKPAVRLFTGLLISAAFLAVTVSRVDLGETARALAGAAPAGIVVALVLVLVELTIRAERWRVLLQPSAAVPLRSAFAYLSIGYFANLLLPARLGDVARAYLAARSFGISALVTLGSVVVERVSDTAVILLVVLVAGLAVAPSSQVAGWAELIAVVAVIGLVVAIVAGIGVLRSGLLDRRFGRQVRSIVARVAEGGAALRRPRGAALVLALTVLPFGVAVCTFGAISGALGLGLDPVEWALVLGVLALSTAIPAAPGSLGTYEFAGVTVLGILGIGSSQALAATVLIHVMALVPSAVLGLVATLILHLRIADVEAAGAVSVGAPADR
jgi:glycosyltransferase 2 family protein